MDLHAAQIQGFFDIPVDHMSAMTVFCDYFTSIRDELGDLVIVSPDVGNVKVANAYASFLDADLAIIDKRRESGMKVASRNLIGSGKNQTVLMVDDMISPAGTICEAANLIKTEGPTRSSPRPPIPFSWEWPWSDSRNRHSPRLSSPTPSRMVAAWIQSRIGSSSFQSRRSWARLFIEFITTCPSRRCSNDRPGPSDRPNTTPASGVREYIMSSDTPTITVETREKTGTRYAQRLRRDGRLPAVIYGKGSDPVHVSIEEKTILNALHDGAHVLSISVDGKTNDKCLVKDLQFGWLGDNLIHLDLTRVNMNEIVTVNVPVNLIGTAKIASAAGAVMEVIRREIEVTCKVSDIPSEFTYDITDMGEVVTIGDLSIPANVTPVLELEKHICHVTLVHKQEAEGEETEAAGDSAEPEVITKAKEEEGDDDS